MGLMVCLATLALLAGCAQHETGSCTTGLGGAVTCTSAKTDDGWAWVDRNGWTLLAALGLVAAVIAESRKSIRRKRQGPIEATAPEVCRPPKPADPPGTRTIGAAEVRPGDRLAVVPPLTVVGVAIVPGSPDLLAWMLSNGGVEQVRRSAPCRVLLPRPA